MAAKDHEELQRQLQEQQLQHLLSTKGHEGPRRTTKNCNGNFRNGNCNTFCPRRTQRATENGNCNTFCPRRAAKDHEELQRQLQERQLQHLLSTEDTEGHGERQLQHLLSTKGREGPRRTATATSGTATATPFVHGGHRGPRRATENGNCRTATATPFVHEGPRRAAKNTFFCPRRIPEGDDAGLGRRPLVSNEKGLDSALR